MKTPARKNALRTVLDTAFDVAYMSLLETDQVSLDTDIQTHLREVVVNEVYGVLREECARMGKKGAEQESYFCSHAFREVSRRLTQELLQEDATGSLPPQIAVRMEFLPAFETVDG
jgi:hypothetical protein